MLKFKLLTLIFAFSLVSIFAVNAFATSPNLPWCHVEPNGNQQNLSLPASALQNAGHMDASGNPLHAGDHAGACEGVSPTVTPTPTVEPCDEEEEDCEEVSPTPTATPTPSVTPTETPSNPGGPGDGLGCASHDCSGNQVGGPTQAVLGTSTKAVLGLSSTASSDATQKEAMIFLGSIAMLASGIVLLRKNA